MDYNVPHNAGNRFAQDPATPKDSIFYLRDTCLSMFTAALFTRARNGNSLDVHQADK